MIGSVRSRQSVLIGSAWGTITATGSADTRTVTAIVVLLAVVGVGLAMLAMWVFRVTRPDRELLAPLEVMGDRAWRRGEPVWQRRRLDEVRPADAAPFRPAAAPPAIDESYDVGPTAPGFEDLHDFDDPGVHDRNDAVVGVGGDDDSAHELGPADEIDNDDATVPTGVRAGGDGGTQSGAGSDVDMAKDVSGEAAAEGDRNSVADPELGAEAHADANADHTIDRGAPAWSNSLSDDVSSTPQDGVTRTDLVAASPSADPEATLADLGAAVDETPTADEPESDDPVRSAE